MLTMFSIVLKSFKQVRLEPHTRPRQRITEWLLPALALALSAALVSPPACAQQANSTEMTPEQQQARQLLQQAHDRILCAKRGTTKAEVEGALRLYCCLVEITDDHSLNRPPREIRITEQRQNGSTVLYDKREQDMFLYMLPLDVDETLLVTVWSTATTPTVRIFHISDGKAKLVMDNASVNDAPQFIQGGVGMGAIVLLGRGRQMHGNLILPTREQIWQWSSSGGKFVLRATVPYGQRWAKVRDMLEGSW